MRYFLNTMIDGAPAFQLARENCPVLRKGFLNGYHYKRISRSGDERYQEVPNKNDFSHIHDALQYGLLQFASSRVTAEKFESSEEVSTFNPVMRWEI